MLIQILNWTLKFIALVTEGLCFIHLAEATMNDPGVLQQADVALEELKAADTIISHLMAANSSSSSSSNKRKADETVATEDTPASKKPTRVTTTISIVGTSGRHNLSGYCKEMTPVLFDKMWTTARELVYYHGTPPHDWGNVSNVHLVSGGAAWSDHVAVETFLTRNDYHGLTLHMPCRWIPTEQGGPKFDDKCKTGQLANKLHAQFKRQTGINSLARIDEARRCGAVIVDHYRGFHQRNSAVAQCDVLIAFSFDDCKYPRSSPGTCDTWRKCKPETKKIHLDMAVL